MHKNRTNQNRHLQPRGYYVQILVGKSSVDQDIKKWDTVIVCSIFHIAVPESLTLRKILSTQAVIFVTKYKMG